jgi:hypothetical protein
MSRRGRTLGLLAAVVVLIFAFTAQIRRGESLPVPPSMMMVVAPQPAAPARPGVHIYDPDPAHLWNRLHASIFARVAADGTEHGVDRVDPLLWAGSSYLLRGPSHDEAVKALREFIDRRGEALIREPLKRASLQRDLWTVFDWLQGDHVPARRAGITPEAMRNSVAELSGPLATVIGRPALAPDAIRTLPDNYAAAAREGAVPRDLFTPGGPWVSVGRPDGPVAAIHVRDTGPGTNSVFLVLLRLPAGRDATLAFLEALRSFSQPLWVQDYPNPALPPFPAGTQVALVRRALLIDTTGHITPSPLTEQVQLRVYREIRPMTSQEFTDAQRIDANMFARAGQDFEELSLSREALFAGRSGGLLPLGAGDRFFLTFSSHGVDAFDEGSGDTGLDAAGARRVCKDCHAAPGVYSFNSYMPFRLLRAGPRPAAALSEISIADAERTAVVWKEQRPDWRALSALR